VLADLERQAERVRAGLLTPTEARFSEHLARPIAEHVGEYITSLEASGASPKHVAESRRVIKAVLEGCAFTTVADLERSAMERWLNARRQAKASARTRNVDLIRLVSFINWCAANGRLTTNPFKGVARADEKADPRRKRRAMTEPELARLLDVARRRPLLDALTVRKGKRKGEAYANVRPEVREGLQALGLERALIYKTLVLTGLRKGELASLTVAQLRLDGSIPHVELDAEDEKNREGNGVVIRADLAEDLKHWLAGKLAVLRAEARRRGEPIPARLPGSTPVFNVPTGLIRIFDRDLKAAGISKTDERGRSLDVHALRTTFGTLLSRGGVPLRTAQAAMRHADPSMTANVYTDPSFSTSSAPSMPCRDFHSTRTWFRINSEPEQSRQELTTTAPLHCSLHYLATNGRKRRAMLTR
jgi:integrase